ncbi:aminoglycoside phosphotransferase [Halobacteriales archaeon QH_2_65_14]|nr:MAG: aminoglycoside phosphotransferase [Halobacteriales archaeon QH_2_65_14]
MASPPGTLSRIVETALGCSVQACEPATGGRMAETYLLELSGEPRRAVCKLGGPSVRTGDVVEPAVLRLVGATTELPVPGVLASGTLRDGSGDPTRWGLYELLAGDPPTPFPSLDPSVRRRVVRDTGETLGVLHATHQFERTGGLGIVDGSLRICDPKGPNFPEQGRRLARLTADYGAFETRPVLTHGDLFPGNLLVDESGGITGLLDWGNAHVTTAGYALARAEMRFVDWFRFPTPERGRLRTALRDGYREHRPLPADYPELGRFYKGLWLAQSADRIRRHLLSERGRRQLGRHLRSLLP